MMIPAAPCALSDPSATHVVDAVHAPVTATADRCWEPDLVEHVAVYAAERGDAALEQLCDDVLTGMAAEQLVHAAIPEDVELADWCGPDRRYRRRDLAEPLPGAALVVAALRPAKPSIARPETLFGGDELLAEVA